MSSWPYRRLALVVVLMSTFAVHLTLTILTIALPDIARDFSARAADAAWVTLAPIIVSALLVPALGRAADMYGRRRVWLAGLCLAFGGMILCGTAWTLGVLVAARILTGIGLAAAMPSGLALVTSAWDPNERGRPIGWWTATMAISPMVGVVVGGVIVEHMSWRWLFFAQVLVLLPAIVLSVIVLREQRYETDGPFDWAGAGLLAVATFGLMFGVNRGPVWGWTSPLVVACLAAPFFALAAFARVERRAPNPVIPLPMLRDRVIGAAIVARMCLNSIYMGGFIILPFFLREVQGWTPAVVSLALFPRPLAMGLVAPISGNLTARIAPAKLTVAGAVAIVVSVAVFTNLDASTPYGLLLFGLVVAGVGLGLFASSTGAIMAGRTHESMLGAISGLQAITQSVANSIGMAVMLSIVEASGGTSDASAYSASFGVGLAITVVGVVAAVFLARRLRSERGVPSPAPLV
jgi:EmrB/QacA subfamily drug resistance transporter